MSLFLGDESAKPERGDWFCDFQCAFRREAQARGQDAEALYAILVLRNLAKMSWRMIGRKVRHRDYEGELHKATVQRQHALAVEIAEEVTGWTEPG